MAHQHDVFSLATYLWPTTRHDLRLVLVYGQMGSGLGGRIAKRSVLESHMGLEINAKLIRKSYLLKLRTDPGPDGLALRRNISTDLTCGYAFGVAS